MKIQPFNKYIIVRKNSITKNIFKSDIFRKFQMFFYEKKNIFFLKAQLIIYFQVLRP